MQYKQIYNRHTRYPHSTLFPFLPKGSLFKLNIRKKGTLIFMSLLGNLAYKDPRIKGTTVPTLAIGGMSHPPVSQDAVSGSAG